MELQKYYPMTTAQKLNFLSWKYTTHKQIMNIPTSCLISADLDLDLLRKSVGEAIERNDSFGIRITRNGKDTVQFFTDRKALLIENLDFTGRTYEEMELFFNKTGQIPIPLYDQPLAKIYIVKGPDGSSGLYSVVCHLMMDTWAISLFYKDVMAIYESHSANSPMPPPVYPFEPVIQKELEYKDSDKYKKDFEFWQEELGRYGFPPMYTSIDGIGRLKKYRKLIRKPDYPFCRTMYLRTRARHELLSVQKEDVDRMKEFCEQNRIPTMQLLFFVGLRSFLARVSDRSRDVTILNVLARRGTLEEKRSGGTRPIGLYVRTVFDEDLSFLDSLTRVMEKQNTLYRKSDVDTMEIIGLMAKMYGMKMYEGYATTMFTFQPIPLDFGNGWKVRSRWYCNGTAASSVYVMVMDGDEAGSLNCYYEYLYSIIPRENIYACHDYILKVIRTGMENPGITMKELLDLPLTHISG